MAPSLLVLSIPDRLQWLSQIGGGGKQGATNAIYRGDNDTESHFFLPDKSPQFNELYATFLVLTYLREPFNLYSDSVSVVNLPPWLACSYVKLDGNPLSPLLIKISNILQTKTCPIFISHIQAYSSLPETLSGGNALVDKIATTGAFTIPPLKLRNSIS